MCSRGYRKKEEIEQVFAPPLRAISREDFADIMEYSRTHGLENPMPNFGLSLHSKLSSDWEIRE